MEGEATTFVQCGKPAKSTDLTCSVISGTLRSGFTWWRPNGRTSTVVMECNTNNDACDPVRGITGYDGVPNTTNATCTLIIQSFNTSVDVGNWTCQDGPTGTGKSTCIMPSIVTNSSINVANALPSQEQINSKKDFNISTVIDCAFPSVNMSWVFGDSQTLAPVITTDDTGCNFPLVKTIAVLMMNDKSMTGQVAVSLKLIHPSFENEVLYWQLGIATFPVIQCSCDWTIHFAYTQAILIVVVIIAAVASFLVFKEFKHKWLLCAVLGAILTVLGVTCAILLGVNDTCSSCKQGAYVAAAIFCALSLCVGVTTDIWVVLKFTGVCGKTVKWARVSCFGADVESKKLDGGKRKAPEGRSDSPPKTDSSPRRQPLLTGNVGSTASPPKTDSSLRRLPPPTGNVGSTDSPDRGDPSPRPQPPPTGNVPPAAPEDQGDSPVHTHPTPRRLPPLDGNISPTTTSASEVEPKVISEPESDVTKKKKKKKKKRSTKEESESKEMSEMKEEK
ncbi:uncharacterized protein LOC121386183 isoform X2 [Gigantopelta aegis]|uniref:uncharacterized protein LOC121386183 isoform X2 n=1 Tax=Gigantopelta aegis TaxID=1735272 RepID=UPI001B88876B|nr:uncharacterized protein LOC121386183 isoform X2 [Gigantopelta aegis]